MVDLSAEGCGIRTMSPLEVGTRVSIDLTVEGRLLTLHARVVWAIPAQADDAPTTAGMEFQSLTQDQSNALTKVVMQMQREKLLATLKTSLMTVLTDRSAFVFGPMLLGCQAQAPRLAEPKPMNHPHHQPSQRLSPDAML